jgi:hypothetical protein
MTETFFAVDPCDVSEVTKEARRLMQGSQGSAGAWSLLVDAAFDPNLGTDCMRRFHAISIYAGTRWTALEDHGPLLIPLASSKDDNVTLLSQVLRRASGKPMVSLLHSPLRAEALATHWKNHIAVLEPDGDTLLLRWADSRCATPLAQTLSSGNWQRLTAPLLGWWTLDRRATWRRVFTADSAIGDVLASGPMRLAPSELAALVDAGLPDAILATIADQLPELLPMPGCANAFESATKAFALGSAHGIDKLPDLVALTILALGDGDEALQAPALHELLAQPDPERPLAARLLELT